MSAQHERIFRVKATLRQARMLAAPAVLVMRGFSETKALAVKANLMATSGLPWNSSSNSAAHPNFTSLSLLQLSNIQFKRQHQHCFAAFHSVEHFDVAERAADVFGHRVEQGLLGLLFPDL